MPIRTHPGETLSIPLSILDANGVELDLDGETLRLDIFRLSRRIFSISSGIGLGTIEHSDQTLNRGQATATIPGTVTRSFGCGFFAFSVVVESLPLVALVDVFEVWHPRAVA